LLVAYRFEQLGYVVSATILGVISPRVSERRQGMVVLARINCDLGQGELNVGTGPFVFAVRSSQMNCTSHEAQRWIGYSQPVKR
jgi:hypothetical protein